MVNSKKDLYDLASDKLAFFGVRLPALSRCSYETSALFKRLAFSAGATTVTFMVINGSTIRYLAETGSLIFCSEGTLLDGWQSFHRRTL